MSTPLRIVFMGTPSFAVRILAELQQSQHQVVGVVTVADKPAGRGQQLHQSAVKQYALANNLSLLQPEKLRNEDFIADLTNLKADLFVVVAFRMLPEVVWKLPRLGTFNLHASLLPAYRGAAPINWALINGDTYTGVSTFLINEDIDAGSILLQEQIEIGPNMTFGELHDELQELGAQLTLQTCKGLADSKIIPKIQKPIAGKRALAPKLFKENTRINWALNAEDLHNFVRGLDPYPAAWCALWSTQKETWLQFKIYRTSLTNEKCLRQNGPQAHKEGILFPCGNQTTLLVKEIQMEGKKRMDSKSFMAGNDLSIFQYSQK
ncbi:MAG: methionyl-tRNA formyltransferase [Cryomorphaceae bacterium]|jgi:methionyl-tRNA formyltransferase|nr:methionyl-tRNA formyltransferase [Cryomorphaceae bacterium]